MDLLFFILFYWGVHFEITDNGHEKKMVRYRRRKVGQLSGDWDGCSGRSHGCGWGRFFPIGRTMDLAALQNRKSFSK